VVEMLQGGLASLGCAVTVTNNTLEPETQNIVVGAHLLDEAHCRELASDCIIYNFEQLHDQSGWVSPGYLAALGRCEVWEYSHRNLEYIARATGNERLRYVPIGYTPSLTRIVSTPAPDIDVLFYGSMNDRRAAVIEKLRAAGLNVHTVFGVYGAERDTLIARAKVVLNLHYYDTSIFEIVRVFYLLANRKAVVAECHDRTEIYPDLREGIRTAEYDGLVDACTELVRDDSTRKRYETVGFERMKARPISEILRPVVDGSAGYYSPASEAAVPRKLNLGSGKDWRADFLNVDMQERVKPDLVLDFCKPLPWGSTLPTERFGGVTLEEGTFDLIIANDTLEHMPDLITAMTSCLKLLRDGGEMHILVPYDLSYGAWQDPSHVRAFNERSWLYYTDWFWYLGWYEWRFDLAESTAVLSPVGQQMQAAGTPMEDIMRAPRAVDALQITLRKRATTADEKETAVKMRGVSR